MSSARLPSAIDPQEVVADLRAALAAAAVAVRPPQGHLRVVDAVAGGQAAHPYLEARAKVVRVDRAGGALGSYHAILGDTASLPSDDTDVLLWDGEDRSDPAWLASRLAAGGILVVPNTVLPRLRKLGLRFEPGAAPDVTVAFDPRPAAALPAALTHLDRTMCVDRARVLAAIETPAWQGRVRFDVGTDSAHAQGLALLEALRLQLVDGEPDVRALPWPSVTASPSPGAGCDVLAIMPHPDDETIYAGGTICGLSRAGQRVHLVVCTDGAGGRGGPGLGSRRAAELIAACGVLGIASVRCLAWADTGKYRDVERNTPATAGDALAVWTLDRALLDLVASIRAHRPHSLLSLGPEVDPNLSLHGHHLAVGLLVAVAFHLAAVPGLLPELGPAWSAGEHRVMESPWVAAGFETSIAPIDAQTKLKALRCYPSQAYSTRRLQRRLEADTSAETTERTRRVQARRRERWDLVAPLAAMPPFCHAPPEGWAARARAVSAQRRDRPALVDMLKRQDAKLPFDAARARSLQTLLRPDAVVVVTGQQVGWLGGPAYTLVKALAAMELARRVTAQGVPTVPVFWMASGDHDLDEVATAPTLDGAAVRLSLEDRGGPVGGIQLPPDIDDAVEQWLGQLPASVRDEARGLCAAYRPGQTLAGAFAETLAKLTVGTGLLLLDPCDPSMARWARPVFERELLGDEPARGRLLSSPEPHVVPVDRDVTQVFYVDDAGRRQRLTRTDAGASWGDGALDRRALAAALAQSPERFSPAALLRPVVQDHVLPAVATVAGPTERRYLAQMRGLYAWAEVMPSHVVQRPSLFPIAAADIRTLEACGGVDALHAHPHPEAAIGLSGLGTSARTWLAGCEALSAEVFTQRERVRAGLRANLVQLRAAWDELRRGGGPAMEGHRTGLAWPSHASALDQIFRPSISARDLTRAARRLFQLRRSLLRDGRRFDPERLRAWRRVQRNAERRMSTLELCARWGPGSVQTISSAFATLDTRGVAFFGGEA